MDLNPNAPIISVEVDLYGATGHRTVEMVLDTGATYTLISWRLAEVLGYDPAVSPRKVNLATAASLEQARLITVARMRALDVEAEGIDVASLDLPPATRIRGLLGLSFLKHFDIGLRFLRLVLTARSS